jgi:hypothetical protein
MKKSDLLTLARIGVQNITNHSLDPAHAYKVVKFRKELNAALEALGKDEEALRKDAGIEDAAAFDDELKALRDNNERTEEQNKRLEEMEAQLKRFIDLRVEMLKEEAVIDCKTMPYAEWHKLQNENREFGPQKLDILSGYVEDILEGVLWAAPEE